MRGAHASVCLEQIKEDSELPLRGVQVQSLGGELIRACVRLGTAKTRKDFIKHLLRALQSPMWGLAESPGLESLPGSVR